MAKELVTSTGNPRVKGALRLRRRAGRAEDEAILIDGVREIGRAIQAGVVLRELFVCAPLAQTDEARRVLEAAAAGGAAVVEVNEAVFEKLRYGDRTGGLVAVSRRPKASLAGLRLSGTPLLAVVEHTEKPGNLGAILRSADAAGVEAVLAVGAATDVYGPNVIRASLGAVFWVPVVEVAAAEARTWLAERTVRIVAASPDAQTPYTGIDYRGPVALVFGAEAKGLSDVWTGPDVLRACVPMHGRADSLNVATTAALFFYEARRQRGQAGG